MRPFNEFLNFLFGLRDEYIYTTDWKRKRILLTPKNEDVDSSNDEVLSILFEEWKKYKRINTNNVISRDHIYPLEFLNSLNFSGRPDRKFTLKIATPIILIRNLKHPKLVNRIWLVVKI